MAQTRPAQAAAPVVLAVQAHAADVAADRFHVVAPRIVCFVSHECLRDIHTKVQGWCHWPARTKEAARARACGAEARN